MAASEAHAEATAGPTLVIGIGHPYRGDDAVGLAVAQRLASDVPPGVQVLTLSGEPATLLEAWAGAARVILVDAVVADRPPGTVLRLDAARDALPVKPRQYSSHGFSLPEALALAEALGQPVPPLIVYGVQGACFDPVAALSPAVAAAVPRVVARIRAELAAAQPASADEANPTALGEGR